MNDETRNKIVELALLQLKKEYVHGKNGPDTFDCAGLVKYVYKKILNINVYKDGIGKSTTGKIMTSPIGTTTIYEEESKDKDLLTLKRGDILFFHRQSKDAKEPKPDNKYPGHCGIYLGNGIFIHATKRVFDIKNYLGDEYKKYEGKIEGMVVKSKLKNNNYWVKKLVGTKKIID